MIERHVLTQDELTRDRETAEAAGDERGVPRARAQMRLLAELPAGFRIERRRAAGQHGDPGLELTLFDERFRPERMVGKVARRLIGSQRVTWTGGQHISVPPEAAAAFALMLRFAAMDAEGR